jgi:DNA primase
LGRGVSDETIDQFQIGYAPEEKSWLFQFLTSKGYSSSLLDGSGLFSVRGGERLALFRDRVMFPIATQRGDTVAFGGRTLSDRQPKYINSPETPIFQKRENLYGLHRAIDFIKETEAFVIVEGYMDVLGMHQMGYTNCIAPLGTALTEAQIQRLKRYSSKGVLIFDSDEAGIRALKKSIVLLESFGLASDVVALPEGQDPADLMTGDSQEGQVFMGRLFERSKGGFEYLLDHSLSQNNPHSPGGKERALQSMIPFLQRVGSDVKREGFMQLIAEALDVRIESVWSDYRAQLRRESRRSWTRQPDEGRSPRSDETLPVDLYLMIAVAINLQYFSEVRNVLVPEDLKNDSARHMFLTLEECFRESNHSTDCVINRLDDESLKRLIYEKIASEEFSINANRIVVDSVNQIRQRNLLERREQVASQLQQSEKKEPWRVKDLLEEKMLLDDQIEELKVMRDVRYTE